MDKRKRYGIRITSLVMSLITTISFAGCSVKKNDSKYDGSKVLTTNSYSDEAIDNNEKDDIIITDADGKELTTEEVKTRIDNEVRKTTSNNVNNTNNIDNTSVTKSLDSILKELDDNTTKFSPEIRSYLTDLVKNAYNNYDNLANVLCESSLPDKCTFLEEKIINPLKNVNSIDIIANNDPDFYELKSKYHTSRWIEKE